MSRSLDRNRFRPALARLLAGSADGTSSAGGLAGAMQSGYMPPPPAAANESLLDRIVAFLGILAAALVLALAFGAVVITERRFPHTIRLRKPAP
jgi:hypothetical protein